MQFSPLVLSADEETPGNNGVFKNATLQEVSSCGSMTSMSSMPIEEDSKLLKHDMTISTEPVEKDLD